MATFPKNIKDLSAYNELLGDISTKLDRLASAGSEYLRVDTDSFFTANDEISKFEAQLRNAAKIAPNLTKGLQKYADIQKKILVMEKERDKLIKKHKELHEKAEKLQRGILDLSEDENKQLLKMEDEIEEINKELEQTNKSFKGVSVSTVAIAKTIGGALLDGLDKVATAGVNFGLSITSWSFDKAVKGLKMIYDLQERSTKAAGSFALSVGAFTQDLGEATKTAQGLDGQLRALTGGDIGEGYKAFEEFSEGLGFLNSETVKFAQGGLKDNLIGIARATGLSNEEMGTLTKNISIMDDSFEEGKKDTIDFAKAMKESANRAGVSVAKFSKEIVSSSGFMARFGTKGKDVFRKTAEYAAKMGISLKSLEGFADLTDTFEGSAEAASKMNTVFGTSINAVDLMMEQDISKRFDMVRQSMLNQGKTMKDLMPQEVKFLAQTLGISDQEVQAAIREGKTIDEVAKAREKAGNEKEKQETDTRKALAMTAQTLFNFQLAWDGVTKGIKQALKPLAQFMGFTVDAGDKTKKVTTFAGLMTEMFGRLAKIIQKVADNKAFQKFLGMVSSDLTNLFKKVDEFIGGDGIDKLITSLTSTLETFYNMVKKAFSFIWQHKDGILSTFSYIAEHMGTIIALFAGVKFAKMLLGVASFAGKVMDLASAAGKVFGGAEAVAGAAAPAAEGAGALLTGGEAAAAAGTTAVAGGEAAAAGGAAALGGGAAAAEGGGAAVAGAAGIGLGPILLIAAAIAAAVWTAWQAVKAFQDDVGGLATSIKKHFGAIIDRIGDILAPVGDIFMSLWDDVIKPIGKTIGDILDPVMKMFGGDGTLSQFFGTAILQYIDSMLEGFDNWLLAIQVIIEYVKEFAGIISDVVGPYVKKMGVWFGEFFENVGMFFVDMKNDITKLFSQIGSFIGDQASMIFGFWKDAFIKAIDLLKDLPIIGGIIQKGKELMDKPGGLLRDVQQGVGHAIDFAKDVGHSVGSDISSKVQKIEARRSHANTPAVAGPQAAMVMPEMDLTTSGESVAKGGHKNMAEKKQAVKAGGKELTLVAGDVYLDGNLVGRHLLRGAGSN